MRPQDDLALRRFWIFDMDGTLTVAAHDFAAIKRTLGLAVDRPILEQMAEFPPARQGELFVTLDAIEHDIALKSEVQPGATELLQALRQRGAALGIVTRNSHPVALATLRQCGLAEFFAPRFILGREACAPKPSGAGIRLLLDAWQAAPSDAVMVGDYLYDLQAGREVGTLTVHLDASDPCEYAAWADVCVRGLHELRALLPA
jgi:HAD superfamily hydrolase (TIGR01509 family)